LNRAARKYYRTILLGIAAMAALLWAAVDQFGISWDEMLSLFLVTITVVLLVIVAAAVAVGMWVGLRRLFRSKD